MPFLAFRKLRSVCGPVLSVLDIRGGATVLKVEGQILLASLAENFFDPHILASGGTKYTYMAKSA